MRGFVERFIVGIVAVLTCWSILSAAYIVYWTSCGKGGLLC